MTATSKDTIYIDIDDEITGIIDKLRGSHGKVVALVLPKRAAVLQSVVNMKLLKRAADDAKKHVVLITSEAGLLPLAGMVGLHVAKSLTSKPEIPIAPTTNDDEETVDESGEGNNEKPAFDAAVAGTIAVGALAGMPPKDDVETVQLDDDTAKPNSDDSATGDETPADSTKSKKEKKPKKDKSLHVPNFERFRMLLILGILILIALIAGAVYAINVLPKATIGITTDATNVNVDLNMTLSTTATSLDTSNNTVPATLASQQKTYSQQVPTTGQQNNGNPASGTITIVNCGPNVATLPDGTGFSANNATFISTEGVTIPTSNFKFGGACKDDGTATVNVQAQSGGASFNMPAGATFTIANNPAYLSASGSAMTGGTDDIVQTVSQNDINAAKTKISTDDSSVKTALENQLQGQGLYPLPATFTAGTPTVTTSANVGAVASTVTVSEVVTYTMFGVQKSDLQTLVDSNVDSQINTSKQSILDEGIDNAAISVQSSSSTGAQLSFQTVATAGPQLDTATIKQNAVGKKSGDVKSQLETNPDVTGVSVKLSPFWVTTVPSKASKITVTIAKPTTTASRANDSNP